MRLRRDVRHKMRRLDTIRRDELEEYHFPGTDAAVLVIEAKIPQDEIENSFKEISSEHRIYPTATGWKIKFPYWYVEAICSHGDAGVTLDNFVREEKGWDHEHCSYCQTHIAIGERAFTVEHERGGVYVICVKCAEQCK